MQIDISDLGQIESFYNGFSENYDSTLNERNEVIGDREINLKKIDNIKFDQIDHTDHPDYSDAYIISADMDGKEMTEGELDLLNENRDFVHDELFKYLF
jgi:hypothetical protein